MRCWFNVGGGHRQSDSSPGEVRDVSLVIGLVHLHLIVHPNVTMTVLPRALTNKEGADEGMRGADL